MKKKITTAVLSVIFIVLAVLFFPIYKGSYDDGGTMEFEALTYKLVKWNKISIDENGNDTLFEKLDIYFGKNKSKSIDELWMMKNNISPHKFLARFIDYTNGNGVVVSPLPTEEESKSSDQITFNISNMNNINVSPETVIEVIYDGNIMESYPAKINAVNWNIAGSVSHIKFPIENWIDKTEQTKQDYNFESHVKIVSIYKDCFFVSQVIPTGMRVAKINGDLNSKWCVGDQVEIVAESFYYFDNRGEGDLVSIKESDFQPDPLVCYKPVIYLYPEQATNVNVKLNLNGNFTCTYPKYDEKHGWNVKAMPDGTLIGKDGREYNYLYWEGDTYNNYDMSKGFCIKGKDSASFLEYALSELGLTAREANEFIVFWLPLMEKNEYNIISFQEEAYTNSAKLDVTPAPDTIIRVFMTFKASDNYVEIEKQTLSSPERLGFTLVEWGGTEIK